VKPAWPIETERLVLRPFREDDFEAMYAMQSDPEVARWLYNESRDAAETRELLAQKIGGHEVTAEGQWLSAAIALRASGEVVGDLSLQWLSERDRTGELGFMFHPLHQGRGYATEAARALLDVAFAELGLHRVIGRCEARNIASARVLEKLGLRREAHLVENEWVKGEWQSEFVYAVLEREWQPAPR
jgi:RimJ/RimL family protein N-acetyltransferase